MNESCHTYGDLWMSHVTHMNASCHTYEWVMSYMWMSHVIHMNESCHTHTAACAHCVTHMKESCHTYEGVVAQPMSSTMSHAVCATWLMSHVTSTRHFDNETWLMSHFDNETGLMSSTMSHEPCHTWLISRVTHDSWVRQWVMSHIWRHSLNKSSKHHELFTVSTIWASPISCHTYGGTFAGTFAFFAGILGFFAGIWVSFVDIQGSFTHLRCRLDTVPVSPYPAQDNVLWSFAGI